MDFVWTSIIHSFDVNHWRYRVLTHHHLSILNDLNSWRDLPAPWRSHGFVWSAESKGQQQTMLNFSRTTSMTTMTCLDLDEAFPQKVCLGWPRIGILLSSFVILGHVTQKDRNGTDAATCWHSWCALMTATEALQTNSYGTKPCHNSVLNAGRFPAISEVENWNYQARNSINCCVPCFFPGPGCLPRSMARVVSRPKRVLRSMYI